MTRLCVEWKNIGLLSRPYKVAVEGRISDRLIELFGNAQKAKIHYTDPNRDSNPMNRFNLFFSQAQHDCIRDLEIPPCIQNTMKLSVRFED